MVLSLSFVLYCDWMRIEAALHCWLLISFCFAFSLSSSPSLVAMAAAASEGSSTICMQMEDIIGGKSQLGTCPSQDLVMETKKLKEIAIDYTPDVCHHNREKDEISITFDERGGARWRTLRRFSYGTFSAKIKCPDGETSGLNYNLYLSSLEGDKSQDEIDFEFLGKDKGIVQTNYYTVGTGNREQIHQLGFDCSQDFHEYTIRWSPARIEWLIDGKLVRSEDAKEGESFPSKPMFLYASVWDASYIDEGRWTGPYFGHHAPYVCRYKDIHIPVAADAEE